MSNKVGSTASRITSGAHPSEYLVSGENIKWSGKPAAIVILGRGLLLAFFAVAYLVSMLTYNGATANLLPVAVAVIACLLMIWVERRFGLLGGLVGIGIAVVALISNGGLSWYWFLIPLVFALLALLFNYIYLNRVLFMITDRRIITRYGIFSLRYAEVGVDKIQNVTVIQPWYERLLGYGDIFFATSGEKGGIDYESPGIKLRSGGAVSWENIEQPFVVNKIASAVVNPAAMPVMVVNQPTPQPFNQPTPNGISTSDRLKELEELRQKGFVTQQEYDEKRKQILEKL
jgi:hypothetical protein